MRVVRQVLSVAVVVAAAALALVGALALLAVLVRHPLGSAEIIGGVLAAALVLGVVVTRLVPRVRTGTILELDLPMPPAEDGGQSKLAALTPSKALTLREIVETLERASRDDRISGLIVRPRFALAPRAVIDELRSAIVEFGKTGKPTAAVMDSFGEGGPSNGAYALATACAQITVQESGYVGLTALSVEGNFYRDLLARLGVAVEVFGRGKYKSAPNQLTERGFTEPDREQTERILESFWERLAGEISAARKLTPETVRSLADRGPLLAREALEAGLVDRVAYPDQVIEDLKAQVGPKAKLLYLGVYKKRSGKGKQPGKPVSVAVIRAIGEIHRAASAPAGLSRGPVLAPDGIVPLIRAAAKDKKVKAVVVRIDSPGGSALASDTIWRELVKLRESGKPVVASMGSVAASGGYYLACAADRIVAQPTTITGSIGVFGLQPVLADAKAKLDVHVDEIHTGAEPSPFTLNRKASPARRERMDLELDEIYGLFVQRVADGRKMDIEQVQEVAQGRVWTGADAAGVGLVDELGGFDRALALALELSGAPAGSRAKVKSFPRKTSGLSALRRRKGDSSDAAKAAALPRGGWSLEGFAGVVAHVGFDPRRFWVR